MTKRTLDNTLYIQLMSVINLALPLEYAIRAAQQTNPEEISQLSQIDLKIRQYWIDLGAREEEINSESLVDFAWDVIQVGFPLTRRHGRRYPDRALLDLIHLGLGGVREMFGVEVARLTFPATGYFRICDLLHGNNVLALLDTVARCLKDSKGYDAADAIELEKFVFGIREPIYLHPGRDYVVSERREGTRSIERFGIVLDTEMEFSMLELKRQIQEFLYQFAIRREAIHPAHCADRTSRELINDFLKDDLFGRIDNHRVRRLDGFISVLTGLYCWDLVRLHRQSGVRSAVDYAVRETQAIYPKSIREVGDEAIRKNYNTVRVAINKVSFGTATKIKVMGGKK